MASFRKEKGKWRAYVAKKGVRKTKTFQSKEMAKVWARRTESEIEADILGEMSRYKTFGDALERYFNEVSVHKKSYKRDKVQYNALKRLPMCNVSLASFNPDYIAKYRDKRLKEVKGSSVNRELNFISAIFTIAIKEWRWSKQNPVTMIKRPENPRHRDRRISDTEIDLITNALGYKDSATPSTKSEQIAYLFLIAIETAMRKSEMLRLTVNDVFLSQNYLTIETSKNGDKRDVPLSKKAVSLLVILVDYAEEEGRTKLFTVSDQSADVLFRKNRRRVGLDDLHFHDSRHEAVSRLARKLDILDLARMVGHRDPRSLMIYYNATASEIASRLD